jgi:hypothetical protein
MKSYEALNNAIGKNTKEHAKALHVSSALVYKWQEPSTDFEDSGAYNPLDRLETIIQSALNLGASPDDAFSPVYYLAEQFNLVVVPMPDEAGDISTLSQELLKTVAEFGDLTKEAAGAMADGKITPHEFCVIEREAWELIRQVAAFAGASEVVMNEYVRNRAKHVASIRKRTTGAKR